MKSAFFHDDYGYYTHSGMVDTQGAIPPNCIFLAPAPAEGYTPRLIAGSWRNIPNAQVERPQPEVPLRPRLVITSITPDAAHTECFAVTPDFTVLDCAVGAVPRVRAEIRTPSGEVAPVTDTFRLPILQEGGPTGVWRVPFVAGVAEFAVEFDAKGIYSINEATVNRALPPEQQMEFAGIQIFVAPRPAV